ncbi:UvrD-helicase domain-containing protein [Streptomonospora litoralis]|uniref:DNA 3'-5' helicase n=1 Tax=Streptomonospora litoralis TaxID=2498135 RepID=A0A4P6Q6Q7_9ACTN|nr:UvrD-helicase domain-containing protein [Streptomonospora litoralis]QBI56456.1 ATP-dependent DNA helicase UvrD2 [Streptomonospora litoralis]
MNVQGRATLRLLDKADKQIRKLPRSVKGAVYEFQYKFRDNPENPGLNLKILEGVQGGRLYSARVNKDYRALLLHAGESDYVLVAVRPRGEVYDNLERFKHQINQVTGGIEFIDMEVVESATASAEPGTGQGHTDPAEQAGQDVPAEPAAPDVPAEAPRPLFADYTRDQLRELGVAEALLPLALKVTTDEELYGLVEYAPSLTEDVLLRLADGMGFDEVLEEITRPVATSETVDTSDYSAALARPATRATSEDTDIQAAIEDRFSRWKVFLHPAQHKLVRREYRGPARVSGGPGTGKTIVALHRVAHLAARLPPGRSKEILFTTFNKNLAADLRKRLLELGGQAVVDRVEIVNIDKLATQIVAETGRTGRRRWIDDQKALREWSDLLTELGETQWDAEFLHAEWNQVILGQAVNSRADYFRARRAGRGKRISRAQRAEIWQLVERFTMRLDEKGLWTHRQVAELAARIQSEQAMKIATFEERQDREGAQMLQHLEQSWANLRYPYRHVVVDEAQDLSPAHWKLLRALVREGDNDLFLVGDTHQRIYDNYASLSSLGINIRGRSARLTLSYRTTRQILGSALGLLGEESWDNLDDSTETLAGYRSVLKGPRPEIRGFDTWQAELDALAETVAAWEQEDRERAAAAAEAEGEDGAEQEQTSIGVAVPTRDMVSEVERRLAREGVRAAGIGPEGPRLDDAVHVGTLHRFKGLEYRRMAIAGVTRGLVPGRHIDQFREDPTRHEREVQRSRSLLFVAATRARDTLGITWHGTPSPFLPNTATDSGPPGADQVDGALFARGDALF